MKYLRKHYENLRCSLRFHLASSVQNSPFTTGLKKQKDICRFISVRTSISPATSHRRGRGATSRSAISSLSHIQYSCYKTGFQLTIPKTLKPASKLTPFPMPNLRNMGLANRTAAKAKAERQRSLPAKREAAYWGYDIGM